MAISQIKGFRTNRVILDSLEVDLTTENKVLAISDPQVVNVKTSTENAGYVVLPAGSDSEGIEYTIVNKSANPIKLSDNETTPESGTQFTVPADGYISLLCVGAEWKDINSRSLSTITEYEKNGWVPLTTGARVFDVSFPGTEFADADYSVIASINYLKDDGDPITYSFMIFAKTKNSFKVVLSAEVEEDGAYQLEWIARRKSAEPLNDSQQGGDSPSL